ncbi:50S ribosomal protein L24 [archaeon]|nr:50S ribosomal protein L24 [archaeon]|tara:strand:- start:294 stop:674 length:381 start_codon:yes stop_codon:yes gene_type:complete
MKTQFSKTWVASKQRRKQKKYRLNAPLHIKHKFLSVNLSKELRAKHKKRSFPLRKGDLIKVLRGKYKGKSGKVEAVLLKRTKVHIEDIQRAKHDGSKKFIPLEPSNLQIIELDLTDKVRVKALERK